MTFLDTRVCGCCFGSATTTLGDVFKLIVPVGWSAVALMACLAYLLSPLSRGDSPRWGSAALVALSAVAGIGLSVAVYSFHRKTSSFALEDTYAAGDENENEEKERTGNDRADEPPAESELELEPEPETAPSAVFSSRQRQRARTLRIHACLSLGFSLLSTVLAVFFGVFASDLGRCAHETCGADVGWICITLGVSSSWMGVTYLGYGDLRRRSAKSATTPGGSDGDEEGPEVP